MNYIKILKKGLFRTASDGQVGGMVGKGLTFGNYGGSTSVVTTSIVKGDGEIKKEAGKGLTFFRMFRVKQKENKKGLIFNFGNYGGSTSIVKDGKGLTFGNLTFGNYGNYGGSTSVVTSIVKKVLRGLRILKKAGGMGVVFVAVFLAVWLAMPANGAEAAFSCDSGL